MGEVYAREDPVGEKRVRARFLFVGWRADHLPTCLFFLTFDLLMVRHL